jgi:hypothetical protein
MTRSEINRVRRSAALDLLGGECASCGNSDKRVLQFNHKNLDGAHHHNSDRGANSGPQLVAKILSGKVDHQALEILCANCHMIVTYEALYGK